MDVTVKIRGFEDIRPLLSEDPKESMKAVSKNDGDIYYFVSKVENGEKVYQANFGYGGGIYLVEWRKPHSSDSSEPRDLEALKKMKL